MLKFPWLRRMLQGVVATDLMRVFGIVVDSFTTDICLRYRAVDVAVAAMLCACDEPPQQEWWLKLGVDKDVLDNLVHEMTGIVRYGSLEGRIVCGKGEKIKIPSLLDD